MKLRIYAMSSFICIGLFCFLSCTKLVEIDPPKNTITTSQVFSDSADAVSALLGVYSNLALTGAGSYNNFSNSGITIFCGMSADELFPFNGDASMLNITANKILASNGYTKNIWDASFPYIYQTNAIIEGVEQSSGISQENKDEFIGEAKFLRAFINFYLVNLYGNIPIVTSTSYKSNELIFREPVAKVFDTIVNDLIDAQKLLKSDYSSGNGERIRANKWAATALLARVYLYLNKYTDAELQSTLLIENSNLFGLVSNLNEVFLKNSSEAILQWQNNSHYNTSTYNATPEAYIFIPYSNNNPPNFYLSNDLLNSFEVGDNRLSSWVRSYVYLGDGNTYYYPFKYKIGPADAIPDANVTEYYTVLRLSEQYLIRAEAEAKGAGGGLNAAIADLNTIRNRAGLPDYNGMVNQDSVLNAIYHEDQIEFFAEWGHRWFDLKRTGRAHNVLSAINYKQPWQGDYQLLYPIPLGELQKDPNLVQNTGY